MNSKVKRKKQNKIINKRKRKHKQMRQKTKLFIFFFEFFVKNKLIFRAHTKNKTNKYE
jgi:hypothetical protein